MSVSLSEIIRAARARRASLAGESAGYLVLAVADQMLGAPRCLRTADVELCADGTLRLTSGAASTAEPAERAVRGVLEELLLVASSGNPSLLRAARRTAPTGLEGVVRELEAALIPANRAAARRALSRLYRETARARDEGSLGPELPAVERELAPPTPPLRQPTANMTPAPLPEPTPQAPPLILSPVAAPAVTVDVAPWALELVPPLFDATENAEVVLDLELESPTRAIPVAALAVQVEPEILTAELEILTAEPEILTAEPEIVDSELEPSPTIAMAVPNEEWQDVELSELNEEAASDESPTRALPVVAAEPEVEEVCTRPEPVVLRASQIPPAPPPDLTPLPEPSERPVVVAASEAGDLQHEAFVPAACLPMTLTPSPLPLLAPDYTLTPALGSLAGELPVLSDETIDELSAEDVALRVAAGGERHEAEACSEPAPAVSPLSPSVSILPNRSSELAELVASFSVGTTDSSGDLCRAVKEMAGIELTPAPFAALVR